jgi:hypothetical protein
MQLVLYQLRVLLDHSGPASHLYKTIRSSCVVVDGLLGLIPFHHFACSGEHGSHQAVREGRPEPRGLAQAPHNQRRL